MKYSLVIANLSWNPKHWQVPVINHKAHHSYARKFPGHESLNFNFNKTTDTNSMVFGYVETGQRKFRSFNNGGIFIFYSMNTDNNTGYIVSLFGNVETLDDYLLTPCDGFENNQLVSNIKADRSLSVLFPKYLKADKYKKYSSQKRLVGQIGFTYYQDTNLLEEIIFDEIKFLQNSDENYTDEILKLKRIYKYYLDQEFDFDNLEQQALEEIKTLPILTDYDSEFVIVSNVQYKRDNVLIANIKRDRGYRCQICGTQILKNNGKYYIEAAHIIAKKNKGNEKKENILVLCPNHHKEFDFGKRMIIEHTSQRIKFLLNGNEYELSLT